MFRTRTKVILPVLVVVISVAALSAFSKTHGGGYDSYTIGTVCTAGAWVTFETTDPTWHDLQWGCDDEDVCSESGQCSIPGCSGTLIQNRYHSNSYYFQVEIWTAEGDVEISAAGCN